MKRILLIDDDKDDQTLFCDAVAQISPGLICDLADDGLKGIEMLASYDRLPELVFLDINMPFQDGRETIKIIRSTPALKTLPVIIYSTSASKQEILWFQSFNARFITKPNSFQALIEILTPELRNLLTPTAQIFKEY